MSTTLLSGPNDTGPGAYAFDQVVLGGEVTIARFTLRASELKQRLHELNPRGESKRTALIIVADTFILDDPVLGFDIVLLTTRVLDITQQNVPFVLTEKPDSGTSVLQVMFGELRGRRVNSWDHLIKVVKRDGKTWIPWEVVREPTGARGFTCYHETRDNRFHGSEVTVDSTYPSTHSHPFYSALRRPQVWNMAKAQFAAATLLLDNPARREEALSMLQWIVFCTNAVARWQGPTTIEAHHLNYQANALLLFARGGNGARYVPIWSEPLIKTRIDDLLGVLRTYEERIRTLEIRSDIQGTVDALAAALRDVSAADDRALQESIRLNNGDIAAQTKQFKELLWGYEMEEATVRLRYIVFKSGLAQKTIVRTTMAVLEIVGAVVQMGAACYGANFPDPKAAQTAATSATTQSQNLAGMFINAEQMIKDAIQSEMLSILKKLKAHLDLSAKIGVFVGKAAEKANELNATTGMETRGTIDMPELAEMGALDPEMDWNIFVVKIEVMLQEFISDPDGAGTGAVTGAREYFIALRTLAEYGRALSLKSVALARLQSRALELAAQRNATQFAIERWTALHAEARTAAEKFSVGRAILLEASLNTKRSLVLLAEGYRAAHAYNNLAETPLRLQLTMDYNAMNEEFRSLKNDIASLFVAPIHMQEVTTDYFELPVVVATAGVVFPAEPHAVLRLNGGTEKPTLTWSMPFVDPPFKRWLSTSRSAYFVQEARFYLEGAEPGADGMIGLRVATTGQYHNGYGATPPATFVSQGISLDFIYDPTKGDAPSSTWKPVGRSKDNYMSPTPFTSWVATIERSGSLAALKKLRLKLWLVRQNAPAA